MPDIEGDRESAPAEAEPVRLSRRELLRASALGAAGLVAAGGALALPGRGAGQGMPGDTPLAGGSAPPDHDVVRGGHGSHADMMAVGELEPGGFSPTAFITRFDSGKVSRLPSGQTLREYEIIASEREIEVAPGVKFPAWTYNGEVPGPTIRCTEGDRLRVRFLNGSGHPHTIHFHGIHPAGMDGAFEMVQPGGQFTYEFDAEPFGLHLYHCHAVPLKRHIHKGLYGVFLVDPKQGRPPAHELVMVMNGFDTNFDGENEVYAVNTVAHHYQKHPIPLRVGELVRVYLVNITEFDLINSFHLHGNFFRCHRTGTDLERFEYTDTVMLCQGERAVLEFAFRFPGPYLFHAHQSEFVELGWTGIFDVREDADAA